MKKILFLVAFIVSYSSFAQFKSGKVIYEGNLDIQSRIDEIKANKEHSPRMKKMLLKSFEGVRPVYFTMVFTKNECSIKKEKKPLKLEDGRRNFNHAFYEDNAIEIYTNISENEKRTYLTVMKEETLILAKNDVQWKLLNETKKIGDYLCYKAITEIKGVTLKGDKQTLATAWYTPKIPVSFTPRGFNNLPGLAIQLQFRNFTYTVTKIKLSNKNIKIAKPTKGVKVTQEQFYQKEREIWEGIKALKKKKK